jgi:predicted secreted Zn-dependent protease
MPALPYANARWLPLVIALLAATPVRAEPKVIESVHYYDVTGATAREVRASLNREGPISGNDDKRYDAVCRWNVAWKFQYRRGNGSCGIESATTEVKITITFPRLKTDETTSASLVKAFASYSEKLMVHEKGHAQNAIDTAQKIEAGILALRPEPTCDAMRTAANALGQTFIKAANQADIDYDRRTQHGATQGARFPQ